MFCWRMIRENLVEALAEIDDLCERLRYLEMGTLPEGAYGRWCEKCWKGTSAMIVIALHEGLWYTNATQGAIDHDIDTSGSS